MPAKITSTSFFSELQGVSDEPVDWLLANVGDKLTVELDFKVETFTVGYADNEIIINSKAHGYIGDGWIISPVAGFKDFKVGDTLMIYNYVANTVTDSGRTIIDKIDDNVIRLDADVTGVADNNLSDQVVISVTIPITAATYKYNFIENDDAVTFNSKISGTEQVFVNKLVDANNTTSLPMVMLGEDSWKIGSATIEGVSIDNGTTDGIYKSKFKIIHETFVTPFMLAAQLLDVAPDYFFKTACLKGVFDIEAMYDFTDPNRIQTIEVTEVKGNTGWFNENFNTGLTNYSFDTLAYTKSDATSVVGVQGVSDNYTAFTFKIKNATDTPFSNNNTKFSLGFIKLPSDESEYQLNGRNVLNNFVFDRLLQTVGSAAVDGDNYGGTLQVFKSVIGTYNSNGEITISGQIYLGSLALSILGESETPKYAMFVSVQDYSLEMSKTDKVTLLIDKRNLFYDEADDGMITFSVSKLLRHPESNPDTQGIDPNGTTAGSDPTSQVYVLVSGSPDIIYVLQNFGVTNLIIGNALWNTDMDTTMADLVTSMNTNTDSDPSDTSGMKAATGFSTFDNSIGYAGSYNSSTNEFTLTPPVGINAGINSQSSYIYSWAGTVIVTTPSSGAYWFNGVDPSTNQIDVFPEDELVQYDRCYIDLAGRTTDVINLVSVTAKVKAKNGSTLEEFDLDSFNLSMGNYPFIGAVQYFNFATDRGFHIPTGSIFKQILVNRRTDLDTSTKFYFEVYYPFLLRWEYWTKINQAHSDFFDTTADNNGWNEFWHHYQAGNWNLYTELIVKATKNGSPLTYSKELMMTSNDWDSNPDYTPVSIKTYDPDTNAELTISGSKYILGYKDTIVRARFNKVSAAPVLADSTVNVRIEVFEQGGINGSRRMSSKWASDSDTWFKSSDTSYKTLLTLSSNTITAETRVDFTKIPANAKFKISARIYEIVDGGLGKLTEDGGQKLNEDGTFKIIE